MRTTTVTKTSTLTKTIVGIAVLASAGAIVAAVLSTKVTSISTITPSVDISVTIEKAEDAAMDIRSSDNNNVSVLIKNNSLKTAKNVSVTLEYDANLKSNSISIVGSGVGVKSYGCTATDAEATDEDALNSSNEEVGTVTCTYDIPAGQVAELYMNFQVNDVFADCGSETDTSSLDANMTATATYVNDPALSNNTAVETVSIAHYECPEISVDISLEDDSVMTYNDDVREATISITNHDDLLEAHYLPINVFASGGLFLDNIQTIEQVRGGDDVRADGNYLYYDYQLNYVDQTFTPVQIGPGITETYKIPYKVSQYAVECGTSAEAMIYAGIASYLNSDLSDDTAAATVMIEGVDCE